MEDFKLNIQDENASHFDYAIPFEKVDSFAQRVLLTLNTWTSEFAYDTTKGIDYETMMRDDFPSRSLEAFFLFNLKKQLSDFETLDEFIAEHDKKNGHVYISFIAYSKTGYAYKLNEFQL